MSVAFRPTISLNEYPSRMNIFWQTCVNVSHVSQVQPISPDPFTNGQTPLCPQHPDVMNRWRRSFLIRYRCRLGNRYCSQTNVMQFNFSFELTMPSLVWQICCLFIHSSLDNFFRSVFQLCQQTLVRTGTHVSTAIRLLRKLLGHEFTFWPELSSGLIQAHGIKLSEWCHYTPTHSAIILIGTCKVYFVSVYICSYMGNRQRPRKQCLCILCDPGNI